VLLHDRQELDDNLGAGSDHDLALASLLGVVDGIERIVENGSANHFVGCIRFSMAMKATEVSDEVYVSIQQPELEGTQSFDHVEGGFFSSFCEERSVSFMTE
jgi:hypothetical protein